MIPIILYLFLLIRSFDLFKGGKYADECKGIEGATADDLKQLAAGTLPAAKSGKCFIACNLEKLGIVCITFYLLLLIFTDEMKLNSLTILFQPM